MKMMKKLGICALAVLLSIGLGSCSDDEYQSRLKELILPTNVSFDADDGDIEDAGAPEPYTKTFRNEDLSNYEVTSDKTWCSVSIDYLTSTITITAEVNNTFEERSATITFSDKFDRTVSRSFPVTQKQNDCIRVTDKENTYEVATEGGQVVINLESNVTYSVRVQNADWITVGGNGTRGLQTSRVILDVAKNTTESARSAQVYIVNETSGIQAVVFIKQAFSAYLTVLNSQYTVDEKAQDINIYVQTNISFDCYIEDETWLRKAGSRETINDNTVCQKISVSVFTEKTPSRTSKVSIENKSQQQTSLVTITQTRNLYIQESSITIMSGSPQKLTLYNSNNQAVLWTTSDEKVATVDDEGRVTGVDAGVATITVTSSDGQHTDHVTVIVEKPVDLSDKIIHQWQTTYTPYDGVGILSRLECTISNNSTYDLLIKKATLYCDNVVMSDVTYDEANGGFAVGKSMSFKADVPIEFSRDTLVNDTTITEEGDTTITPRTIPGSAIKNTHRYVLAWEYTYSHETFTYRCEYPERSSANARRKAIRKVRR